MRSEHINLKINERYLRMIREIGRSIGINDISSVYGAYPKIIKFSITMALQKIDEIKKGIPTLHPQDLDLLLSSIRNYKTLEYHREIREIKQKNVKSVIPAEKQLEG